MAAEEVARIRNIGIVGHGGTGKTYLADALVFAAGATNRLGKVDDGSSLFDFEPEEVRRRTTIASAFHHCTWKKHEVTLADTPGYSVFQAETRATLAAMTGAVLVLSPHGEVKVELEHAWTWCGELGISARGVGKAWAGGRSSTRGSGSARGRWMSRGWGRSTARRAPGSSVPPIRRRRSRRSCSRPSSIPSPASSRCCASSPGGRRATRPCSTRAAT